MKTLPLRLIGALLVPLLAASCMTTYDAQGNPVQTVDARAVAAGVAAAAVIGYAVGRNNNNYCYRGGGGYYYPRCY